MENKLKYRDRINVWRAVGKMAKADAVRGSILYRKVAKFIYTPNMVLTQFQSKSDSAGKYK